jgi:hypothetical protein
VPLWMKQIMEIVRIVVMLAILAVAVYVALSPRIVYAPQPRVVLYFLLSVLLSVLLGAEAVAQLRLELPGFCFVSASATAVCFAMLWVLNHLSKPNEKIAAFRIVDETGKPVNLELKGAIDVPITPGGLRVTTLTTGNTVVLIFPEQVGEAEIHVWKVVGGPVYTGTVSYAGSRTTTLRFGDALRTA